MSDYTPTTSEVKARFADQSRHLDGVGTVWHEKRFDRWHQAELRRAKAEAWDEGASAASEGYDLPDAAQIHNPYRAHKLTGDDDDHT